MRDAASLLIATAALFIATWALVIQSGKISDNVDRIEAIEVQNRDTARATAYRLCQREVVNRAEIHSDRGFPERRRLERPPFLPILDCRPNLKGKGADILPVSEQRALVRRYMRGELTDEERGICPESTIGDENQAQNC